MSNSNKRRRPKGRTVPPMPNHKGGTEANIPELPDTSVWQPRADKVETLQGAFLKRCIGLEEVIQLRVQLEKEMNIDNYDSGPSVEDILRNELIHLLPNRYSVRSGVINDRYGRTAGDCDIIIFNDLWFPAIKAGATPESRRFHLPIEGVYAVCEVKQSIDYKILDEAMEKLVVCHRLDRPQTNANRLVENYDLDGCFHGLKNPLYSAIIATSLKKGVEIDKLVERFFLINKTLKRLEVVRCLCVLGEGTVTWLFADPTREEIKPTKFMRDDLFNPIFPAYHKVPQTPSALYAFLSDLFLHLYQSVLAAEDIAIAYGPKEFRSMKPKSPDVVLEPDIEWMEKLKWTRNKHGEIVPIETKLKKKGRN
ncbi:MAG TPA: DUF6602 domain-containing protein [Herpetosiphonaceae bacterium]